MKVDVTDVWEQVVFNLVIESTTKPCKNARSGSEIGGGLELVGKHIVFHFCPDFGLSKLYVLKDVGWLEDRS